MSYSLSAMEIKNALMAHWKSKQDAKYLYKLMSVYFKEITKAIKNVILTEINILFLKYRINRRENEIVHDTESF